MFTSDWAVFWYHDCSINQLIMTHQNLRLGKSCKLFWATITCSSSSEFCCNLYQSFVSRVTSFVILLSYIIQARKSLVQIDQLAGVIKTPVKLCCSQRFGCHVGISTKPCDTKLKNDWLKPFNKWQLVEQNRAMLYFHSTMFNMLNGIFQQSASHDTLFNIMLNSSCNIWCSTNVEPCIIRLIVISNC